MYKILILIVLNYSNLLFAQDNEKINLNNIFLKEYVNIDKELCLIVYNLVTDSLFESKKSMYLMRSDVSNDTIFAFAGGKFSTKGCLIKIEGEFTDSNTLLLIKSKFLFNKKWWDMLEFGNNQNAIKFKWTSDSLSLSFVATNEYINSFRKDTYQKKQDLALSLVSYSGIYNMYSPIQINLDSVKVLKALNKFKKVNDEVYFTPIDKYNDFYEKLYYKNEKKYYELLYNNKYPLESIVNILSSNDWFYKDTIDVNLKHKLYGNDEVTQTINLSSLNGYFSNFTNSYISIIDSAKETNTYKINQLKISYNKQSVHLIKYEIPKNHLFNKSKISINATLYSNIRLDNLADIDKQDVKKTTKIKLKL